MGEFWVRVLPLNGKEQGRGGGVACLEENRSHFFRCARIRMRVGVVDVFGNSTLR